MRGILPGLLAAVLCAIAARLLHGLLPANAGAIVGEVVVAVLLGLLIGNIVRLPSAFAPGIRCSFHTVLRIAIVILGAQFSFAQVVAIGGKAVLMILVLMSLALLVAHALGRVARIPGRLATLIGVGTAVCGNTAITATAPVIHARDEEVSFAVATNTLFGTLAVFLYPLLGHALMGAVIVGIGLAYGSSAGNRSLALRLKQSIPLFVVGFLVAALLNTFGAIAWLGALVHRDLAHDLQLVSRFLILVALAGVGLGTRLDAMRKIGATPFLVGLATAATTAIASYFLIRWLGPAGG